MLGIVGTIPDIEFPFVHGKAILKNNHIHVKDYKIPINRCTPALIASALKTQENFGYQNVYVFLAGDTGKGEGSRQIYKFLSTNLKNFDFEVLTFHYLQPDVDWHNKVLFAAQDMEKPPHLIADAGFMYAAKMSGQALSYKFFTPDAGELAFLADELAPHPFYTRGFILQDNNNVEDLLENAYAHDNTAQYMLIKGKLDYIVQGKNILDKINAPSCNAMEAIGGTGDTLTGILSALYSHSKQAHESAVKAAKINRLAGFFTRPTPATQVKDIISQIPLALNEIKENKFINSKQSFSE